MNDFATKADRIRFLLEHWADTYEIESEPGASGDTTQGVSLMPRMYHHPSVKELRRAIGEVRLSAPADAAHMMAFYTAEWRNTTQTVRRRRKKGGVELVQMRVRERVLPRWIVSARVQAGVSAVTEAFRGEVFIPSELLEAA